MKKIITIIGIAILILWAALFTKNNYLNGQKSIESKPVEKEQFVDADQETESDQSKAKSVTFSVAGDVMLDRNVWHNYKDSGLNKLLSNFDLSLFKDADFSVLNLEGPISQSEINDDWQSGSMIFNFPPESVDFLKFSGIKAVSLANNHTYNAGKNNFVYTQNILRENGIENFGREIGFNELEDIYRFDGKVPVSIIGLDALAEYIDSEIINAIKKEKANDRFVIMMPHWGVEYKSIHHSSQEYLVKKWIKAGADMIVGGHPHVIQDFEIIDGVPVFYSLGNFIFDQYFSKETQESIILSSKITDNEIEIKIIPVVQKKSAPQVVAGEEKMAILDTLMTKDSIGLAEKIAEDTIRIVRKK